MQTPLKVEIVSDVSCPWCVIGYQSLFTALEKLAPKIPAELSWKPFELNPKMPVEGQDMGEHLHEKYGSSKADIAQTKEMITGRGKALNFEFNFKENGRIYNTFNAHRLLYWAMQFDKQTELSLAFFGLYFTDGGSPGNVDQLLNAVQKLGLPVDEARKILESDQFAKEVREEQAKYQAMGVKAVPTFIINNKYKLTGGLPIEEFVTMLEKILAEEAS